MHLCWPPGMLSTWNPEHFDQAPELGTLYAWHLSTWGISHLQGANSQFEDFQNTRIAFFPETMWWNWRPTWALCVVSLLCKKIIQEILGAFFLSPRAKAPIE